MSSTRPSGISAIPDELGRVVQEISHIDQRGRLHILPRWIEALGWLRNRKPETVALVTFLEPGRLSLRAWDEFGPSIVERYKGVMHSTDPAELEAMRAIQDRYARLDIRADNRPYLGDIVLAHLGLPLERSHKAIVYIVILPEQIDILSPEYRNRKLIEGHPILVDLP